MPPRARDVGPWTIQKLEFLSEYLAAYVKATRSIQRADVCFMDICAGPGFDRNRDTGEIVEGSPLRAMALYPGFRRFVLVDIDPAATRQLKEIALEKGLPNVTHVVTGDCNRVIGEALRLVPLDGATFCFLDPAGIDVAWSTIRRIANHKPSYRRRIELFVLFAYDMDLVRRLALERDPNEIWGPDVEARVDSTMPHTQVWRRIYDARRRSEFGAREARRRFAYAYWMGLNELGYKYVVRPKLINTPEGHPLYFLFFASDHPAGERIMTHVLQKPRGFEQLSMPILEDPWDFEPGEDWYTVALNASH